MKVLTRAAGTSGREWPGWPGCPPGLRRLLRRRPRTRGRPASPSEAGGFDVVVEEGNLAKLVFALRRELGDGAIETVPKRGYQFA